MTDPFDTRFAAVSAGLPAALRPAVQGVWADFRPHLDEFPVLAADPAEWLDALPAVWAASPFVADICLRQPALFAELVATRDLFAPYPPAALAARAAAALAAVGDEPALLHALRALRRREMLRLAFRDLAGWADLDEVLAALSELADACIAGALERLYAWETAAVGVPTGATSGAPCRLVVLGLGKLGGRELNFSSDIDLMFAYPEDGAARGLSNHEFFTRLGRRLIRALHEVTADGFVFRVDMRLRPNGESGPLALPFEAMEQYYQAHGREWERYALIKARVCAGDVDAGAQLLARLRPFVFRRYLDFGAIEAIRAIKVLIERELSRKGVQNNIKLGPGGIREIEFIAQSFQLVRGGREPALQDPRLLAVLPLLARERMLTPAAVAELRTAYVFLRRVEHRLQMVADRQTQTLPDDAGERQRQAFAMGCASWDVFTAQLARHMRRVHEFFEQTFAAPQAVEPPAGDRRLADVWLGALETATALQALADAGYAQPQAALALLQQLRAGSTYVHFSAQGRERLDRLLPLLLGAAGLTREPLTTLTRLVNLLQAIGRRSAYFALLVENPMALSQLVRLCAASPWIATWLGRHPVLLDELLAPAREEQAFAAANLEQQLRERLLRLPADDLEANMEALREFRHGQVLAVAAADLAGRLAPEQVGQCLSRIAETVLRSALQLAYAGLGEKYGVPACATGTPGFAVIAYGKLGSLELGYGSDLDMVFLYAECMEGEGRTGGARPIGNEEFFARLAQRFLHILTARTGAGQLYPVDTRLRPSGGSGLLVTSLAAFRSYQIEHAWTWEHQALVRARAVAGDAGLGHAFAAVRREVLARPRDPVRLRREVLEMREKMRAAQPAHAPQRFQLKHDPGGLVDIEFLVQYCVLRWAHDHPDLLRHTDNIHLLEALAAAGVLEAAQAQTLAGAYRRYLSTEHRMKLMEQAPVLEGGELAAERAQVSAIWQALLAAPAAGGTN